MLKVIYVSAHSSFIATLKRVSKLSGYVEQRLTCPLKLHNGSRCVSTAISDAVNKGAKKGRHEEVVMKSTGKATEKGLRLAMWWLEQEGAKVEIRAGSVGALDDIACDDGGDEGSRVRKLSCIEVGTWKKTLS